MLKTRTLLMLAATCIFAAMPLMAWQRASASAEIADARGNNVGTATFKPAADGVVMQVKVKGLPPGEHALHIHEAGKCDPPGFTTAGAHFNPGGKQHGVKNPQGHHAGDLPNMTVKPNGDGSWNGVVKGVTLGDGPNSLFHPAGTAVVIHEKADDHVSDPAGNAGARIACGVIK